MDLREPKRRRHSASFSLDILEFREARQIVPEMRVVERPLEAAHRNACASSLRVNTTL